MKGRFSPTSASLAFIAVYAAGYWLKLPLLTYLPLEGAWRLGRGAGTYPMNWYGYVAEAVPAAVLAGLVIPEPRRSRFWSFAPAALAALSLAAIAFRELNRLG